MPQQSKYSNDVFESAMHDVLIALEKNNADRDFSLMVLGNVITNIFAHQVPDRDRQQMVQKFCDILTRSAKG